MFQIAVACLVLTALLAYTNARFVRLPTTVGVMAIALLLSLAMLGLDQLGFGVLRRSVEAMLGSIDFSRVLMDGMLSVLLFAGALQVDLHRLRAYRWQVGMLAIGGTIASTAVVALGLWWWLPMVGVSMSFLYCLVFGALISPTDPVSVMGVLKSAGAPRDVEVVVAGESLFNDGIGLVLFSLLLGLAAQTDTPSLGEALLLLLREAGGGLALGALLGTVLFVMLRSINEYKAEVLLTVAGVLGGYELAQQLHVSAPLTTVVAGLIVGHHGRALAMSDVTRHHVDLFWELLDEIFNAVLFVLLGLEMMAIDFPGPVAKAAAGVILITLSARLLAVGVPMRACRRWFRLPDNAWAVLTWGGLRGGISVALALSLPFGHARDLILPMTYAVVVFSILVQGLSIRRVIRIALPRPASGA